MAGLYFRNERSDTNDNLQSLFVLSDVFAPVAFADAGCGAAAPCAAQRCVRIRAIVAEGAEVRSVHFDHIRSVRCHRVYAAEVLLRLLRRAGRLRRMPCERDLPKRKEEVQSVA